jgi:hypothetical protein
LHYLPLETTTDDQLVAAMTAASIALIASRTASEPQSFRAMLSALVFSSFFVMPTTVGPYDLRRRL